MLVSVVSPVFPDEVARLLAAALAGAHYKRREQRVAGNYAGPQRLEGEGLPTPAETYSASFERSMALERDAEFVRVGERYLRPHLERIAGAKLGLLGMRAHRMGCGDHFRTHVDDMLGAVGYTVCLSRAWRWDWGGLLVVPAEGRAYLPRFNELVVLDSTRRPAHLVTGIAPHALEARLMIVGFARLAHA